MKSRYFKLGERASPTLGVNRGEMKSFIDIDIAETRDEALIEQNALDLAVAPREESFEPPGAKLGGQRFDANASP